MTITACRACGGRVSISARACPHCGDPREPEREESFHRELEEDDNTPNPLAFALLFFVFVLIAYYGSMLLLQGLLGFDSAVGKGGGTVIGICVGIVWIWWNFKNPRFWRKAAAYIIGLAVLAGIVAVIGLVRAMNGQ